MPDLRTVPDVELIHTGVWNISTGKWTVTAAHLRAALAAHDSGVLRKPTLKLGHSDPRFDGEPSIGHIDNMRLDNDDTTLIGDYVGVPGWLADIIASAYPDRSIEGLHDFTDHTGTTHSFLLTGVALLGVTRPGIPSLRSLQDIQSLYDVAAATGVNPIVIHARADRAAPTLTAEQRTLVRAAAARRRHRAASALVQTIAQHT